MSSPGVPYTLDIWKDLSYAVHVITEYFPKVFFVCIVVGVYILEFYAVVEPMVFVIYDLTLSSGFAHCSFEIPSALEHPKTRDDD